MPHSHVRHKIEYALRQEVNELYASVTIKQIAFSMIAIFEPIYLYTYFDRNIFIVLLYFACIYLGFAFASTLAGSVLSRLGVKHSILVSVFLAIGYFLGLNNIGNAHWLIYVIAVILILYKLFFWPAFHLDFARFSQGQKRAQQVSVLKMITLASGILGPFAGGLVIVRYGYHPLFMIVVLLLIASVIPLFFSKEIYNTFNFSIRNFYRSIFSPALRRTELALFAWGNEEMASTLLWPIFMFIFIVDFSVIGGITSATTVIAFLSAYWIGRVTDRIGRPKMLRLGSILTFFAWIFRSLVRLPFHIGLADGFYKLSQEGSYIGFNAVIYDKASQNASNTFSFILLREITMNLGKFAGVAVAAVLIAVSGSLAPTFILAGISSLFFMFL